MFQTNKIELSAEESERYSRQVTLSELSEEGQKKLKVARVLVVGAGGLGCPVLSYLAAAGVGTLGVVDSDNVDRSNLHRQLLYDDSDVGSSKVKVVHEKLSELNPHVKVLTYCEKFSFGNAASLLKDYDVLVDATDNFPSRYAINDACVEHDKPFVYASISQFEGQVAIFNARLPGGGRSPDYRSLFPSAPCPGTVKDCVEGGVLGMLPGIIGSIQALEVVKLIVGMKNTLIGRVFVFDGLTLETRIFNLEEDTGKDSHPVSKVHIVSEISAPDLKKLVDGRADFQLVDVREGHERKTRSIGGDHIPLSVLEESVERILKGKPVIFYCQKGIRSGIAAQWLNGVLEHKQLFSLEGGIDKYLEFVDACDFAST
ncbi:MAG: molybdopterin/thiamine biosynthesis adenylyltransferase/rhodanese-related sulfurtransferase [Chlamydiales bacterium]|jgi:molybdopterin/thiamine biosynthesis adenylyltransferase/rhodanese-related sulfurtransferase